MLSRSVVQLFCNARDCSPPGSSVQGIFSQEYWSWLSFPTPGDLPDPGIEPASLASSSLAGRFFTTALPGEVALISPIPNQFPFIVPHW